MLGETDMRRVIGVVLIAVLGAGRWLFARRGTGTSDSPPSPMQILPRAELLSDILLRAEREEYADATEAWKSLEGKAERTIAVAGIFVAALFTITPEPSAGNDPVQSGILVLALVFLLATIVLGLQALRIRTFRSAPLGKYLVQLIGQLPAEVPDHSFHEMLRNLSYDQACEWREVNE